MTDLTLTGHDQRAGAGMKTAVARNQAFAAAGGHDGASLFPALGLLVVTCLDARVDPARILDLDLGEALVIRNNGGRVTPQLINDLAYVSQLAETARPEGPPFEVAVIHHTQCGAARLAEDAFRRRYAERIGANESTLREYAILDPGGGDPTPPRCGAAGSARPRGPDSRASRGDPRPGRARAGHRAPLHSHVHCRPSRRCRLHPK